ncbi:isoprenoid synthase domain-containing protein [Rhodocollybia butyracea]|uniref:Terpene synthase n=1 Tax=Rhodocollybia butyracea TaxID=206335 RepID=A0A9P5TWE2_9AGAR|nr:isoprenoid synthase domain-containing protein [Rhodocollybia butyracea]
MTYSSFKLPDFAAHCAYRLRFNPYHDSVSAQTKLWYNNPRWASGIISQSDLDTYDKQQFTLLASVCYPHAGSQQLRVCSDFLSYFFYLDNLTDDMDDHSTRAIAEQVLGSLNGPETFESQYRISKMTADYFKRMTQTCNPSVQKRFIDAMARFLKSVDAQAKDRLAGRITELDSYISYRRETSGCTTCWALIEYANNLNIPDHVLQSVHLQEMETAANDVVAFSNDVFSYNIEQSKGDTHNMIPVIMHANPSVTLMEAVNYVQDLTNAAMDRFNQLKAELPSYGTDSVDSDVKKYIEGMESWMVGIIFWSFETERYFGESTQKVKETRVVDLLPLKVSKSAG